MPLHVALDARYIREKPSGIGNYVRALVDRLPAIAPNDRFTFWAHPLAPRPLSSAQNAGEHVVRAGPNSPLPLWWPQLFGELRDVDVFHGPHNILPRGVQCATVVTVHDLMGIDAPQLYLRGVERLVRPFYYPQAVWRGLRDATTIITPSNATADRVIAILPTTADRIRVINQGVEPIFAPATDPAATRTRVNALINSDSPFALVIGANTAAKRHDLALSAFAAAAPPSWRLVLVQRRLSDRRLVRHAERLGIADRIVWLGEVRDDDVIALLQCASVLLQPSLYEGFGLPVLEAMACGCPVVASDIPPFREIADGAALLISANESEGWTHALREVFNSAEVRASLRERGLAQAKKFSWDRCARETVKVYHEAATTR